MALWFWTTLISSLTGARREANIEEVARAQLEQLASSAPIAGVLGRARLGEADDARKAGLVGKDNGLILGTIDGLPVRYAGEGHVAVYAPTGAGKGRDVILPNLGLVTDQSFIVIDPKNGDTTWACWDRRKQLNPGRTSAFNPYGRFGIGSVGINPLDRVVERLAKRSGYLGATMAMSAALVPIPPNVREAWPQVGAQELITIASLHLAHTDKANCCLPEVYLRLVRSSNDVVSYLKEVAQSDTPGGIPGLAAGAVATIEESGGQWVAIAQEVRNGLAFVAPDEAATPHMRRTTLDIARFKREPCSLFIISPADELSGVAGKTQQIVLDYLLEMLASTDGPVRTTFILDEFQNIGTSVQLPKSLNMYRSQGIQLVFFIHDPEQLGTKYTPGFAKAVYSASTVRLLWSLEDEELLRKVEYLSGRATVRVLTYNTSPGPSGSAGFSIVEQPRPLLQVEDTRLLGDKRMLMHIRGQSFYVIDNLAYFDIEETQSLRDPRTVRSDSQLEP